MEIVNRHFTSFLCDITFCNEACAIVVAARAHISNKNYAIQPIHVHIHTDPLLHCCASMFMLVFWISDVKQFQTFNMVRMFVCHSLNFYLRIKILYKRLLSEFHSLNGNGHFISFSKNDCLTTGKKGSTVQIIFDYLTHTHTHTLSLSRICDDGDGGWWLVVVIIGIGLVDIIVVVVIVNSFRPKPLAKKLDDNKFNSNEANTIKSEIQIRTHQLYVQKFIT